MRSHEYRGNEDTLILALCHMITWFAYSHIKLFKTSTDIILIRYNKIEDKRENYG